MRPLAFILCLHIFVIGLLPCLCVNGQGHPDAGLSELVAHSHGGAADADPCSPFCASGQCSHTPVPPHEWGEEGRLPAADSAGSPFAAPERPPRLGYAAAAWRPPIA